MTVKKFTKGQTLLVRIAFEVPVVLEEDCDETYLLNLGTHALLQVDEMEAHAASADVIAVDGVSRETKSAEDSSEDETDEEEEGDWQAEEEIAEAKNLWEELREGKKDAKTMEGKPVYPDLSDNQIQFIRDALDCGLEVVSYSGRAMYGQKCPSVMVDRAQDMRGKSRCQQDSLGLGVVLYAKD